jgi:hypothetical protein
MLRRERKTFHMSGEEKPTQPGMKSWKISDIAPAHTMSYCRETYLQRDTYQAAYIRIFANILESADPRVVDFYPPFAAQTSPVAVVLPVNHMTRSYLQGTAYL